MIVSTLIYWFSALELLGLAGYIFAGVAYFIFILLLIAARNNTLTGRLVLLSSVLIFSASVTSALQVEQGFSLKNIFVFETIKLAFWSILILCTQNNINTLKGLFTHQKTRNYLTTWLFLSSSCWFMALILADGTKYLFLLLLSLNLWTLVLLEQLYRNADVKFKWALWTLIIGLGTTTVFDFIMFAQASMVNQLDFSFWYTRGFIAAIVMPLILVSTRRMKDWSVNVFISREVVFYSSMLLISGGYLLLLAFAGYLINYFGGEWSDVISIAFLILGGAVLAALLITERLRREVKVFITKHFFANKYDYRIEWLKSIEQLEIGEDDDYYKTATNIICSSLEINSGALIKKIAVGQYQSLYSKDMDIDKLGLSKLNDVDVFCQQHGWIIDVREYANVENSYPNLTLDIEYCRNQHIDIIIPIFISNEVYGFFALRLPSTKGYLNWEDRDLLFSLSKQLSIYLSLNEANEKLAESKQFDAFNRMSAFLVHDLKNVQAQLALINSNAKRHKNNPDFITDVFETIESATNRLDKVLSQLRNKQVAESNNKKKTNVNKLIEDVITQRNIEKPTVTMELDVDIEIMIEYDTFFSVLNHLVQNAQEATKDSGWVKIKASILDDFLHLAVLDNGCGMTQEFIKKRLFKPFDTTKGNAGMGIGVYEAKQFIENLGGTMQVTSFENEGSIFHLSIPCT